MENISTEHARLFNINSDLYILFLLSEGQIPSLWELYGIGSANVSHIINRTSDNRIDFQELEGKTGRRSNFRNLTIRATATV
jgi:hypothetical protein